MKVKKQTEPQEVISVRIPVRMKQAIEYVAEDKMIPLSSALKHAITEYLEKNGVDWKDNSWRVKKAVQMLEEDVPTFLDVLKKEYPNIRFEISDDTEQEPKGQNQNIDLPKGKWQVDDK